MVMIICVVDHETINHGYHGYVPVIIKTKKIRIMMRKTWKLSIYQAPPRSRSHSGRIVCWHEFEEKLSQRHISIGPQLNITLEKFFRLSPKLHTPSTHPLSVILCKNLWWFVPTLLNMIKTHLWICADIYWGLSDTVDCDRIDPTLHDVPQRGAFKKTNSKNDSSLPLKDMFFKWIIGHP